MALIRCEACEAIWSLATDMQALQVVGSGTSGCPDCGAVQLVIEELDED